MVLYLEILGFCSSVSFDDANSAIGMFSVRKEYIEMGIGKKLFARVMQHIGHRNAGLASTPFAINIYRKKGFTVCDGKEEVVNICEIKTDYSPPLSQNDKSLIIESYDEGKHLKKMVNYDSQISGSEREQILSRILKGEKCITMTAVNNDSIVGFGTIKENSIGDAMIAPLYADNEEVAVTLITNLISAYIHQNPVKRVYLYSINTNLDAKCALFKLGFKEHLRLPRLFTKHVVSANFDKIYAVLSYYIS
jgi:hypothetical protein